MNHLIISREYPPAAYSAGGIGAYVEHISRSLAEHGETVHVIGQLWPGAPRHREIHLDGRLIIHRVSLDQPATHSSGRTEADGAILRALGASALPAQAFMWQAAVLAESLIESAAIDVIEGQEHEAPLYFLLLRRKLGLASRRVPVIVHLHTPSEFVFRENEWDKRRVDYLPLERAEGYTIRTADALLCPSRFLANIAELHYQIRRGVVTVIPYPAGHSALLDRHETTWRDGTICYVGRLEPRKGVVEWTEAAIAVAKRDPLPRFTFIGGDSSLSGAGDHSMREALRARIPRDVQHRFSFLEAVPRHELVAHLGRARLAVVPSRWENFPYTCIEAMSSGLPVLATPTGGMVEMVKDGVTGWIAAGSDAPSLETALRRALATRPQVLAEMGTAAAAAIKVLCDNQGIVRRQLDFRRRVVNRGCGPSESGEPLPTIAEDPDRPASAPGFRVRFPELAGCRAEDIAVLQYASLKQSSSLESARLDMAPPQGERTMTVLDVVRAPARQQLAIARRAISHPGYAVRWVAWQGRRATARLFYRLFTSGTAFKS